MNWATGSCLACALSPAGHAHRELLRERKVGPGARWSKFKEAAASDERYRALPRESREALFRTYVAEAEVSGAYQGPVHARVLADCPG